MSIPIYDAGVALPSNTDLAYIRAGNGNFILANLRIGDGVLFLSTLAKIKNQRKSLFNLKVLPKINGYSTLHINKIPSAKFKQALAFFETVSEKKHTEALTLILASLTNGGSWDLMVPEQEVSGASVDFAYPNVPPANGWFYVGDAHSHPGFGHSPSDTDHHDEDEDTDGIHIIVPSHCQSAKYCSARLHFRGWDILIPIETLVEMEPPTKFPREWLDKVHGRPLPVYPATQTYKVLPLSVNNK
jgi:hypothetical protein